GPHPQEFHRRDDLRQIGAGHRQDAPRHHADRQEDGVVIIEELLELDVLADVLAEVDIDAHVDDHLDFPEQLVMVETEVRDAGREQPPSLASRSLRSPPYPISRRSCTAVIPAGPEPTTATRLPFSGA